MTAASVLAAWSPTPAVRRGLVVGAGCLALGVLTRHPAAVLLGAPLLLSSLLAAAGARPGPARWWVEQGSGTGPDGPSLTVRTVVELPAGCQLAVLRLTESDGIRVRAVARPPGGVFEHLAEIRPTGWGPLQLARTDLMLCGTDGASTAGPAEGPQLSTVVLPERDRAARDVLRPAPLRVVGRHRRRVPGQSTEPFDLTGYRPGDPLRWVDARASSRRRARREPGTPLTEDLVVRRRVAESDADLLLLVDGRSDLVADLGSWDTVADRDQRPSRARIHGYRAGTAAVGGTLDSGVRLAAALAAAYLEAGDRVAVANLAEPRRGQVTATGSGQLVRVEHLLARIQTDRNLLFRPGALTPSFEPLIGRTSASACVLMIAPLLDDDLVHLALHVRRAGRPLVVADLAPAFEAGAPPAARSAVTLVAAERRNRVGRLRAAGVAVVAAEPVQVAAALRRVAREERPWSRTAR